MSTVLDLIRTDLKHFKPYTSARQLATNGHVWLNANELPWPPAGQVHELNRYTEQQPSALIGAMAAYYDVAPKQLLLARGSGELVDLLCRGFCEPGNDTVVVSAPGFALFEVYARMQGAKVSHFELQVQDGFATRAKDVLAACDDSVKLVFLCSPHNPTGGLIAKEAVLSLCDALAGRALVVLDEAYIEFASRASMAIEAGKIRNLVVLRTLSKAHGLAAARVGAMIGSESLVSWMRGLLPPYPLPAPSADAALRAFELENMLATRCSIRRIREQRERLAQRLSRCAPVVCVYPSESNYLLVQLKARQDFLTACRHAGVVIRDMGSEAGLSSCVRITVGSREDNEALLAVAERAS